MTSQLPSSFASAAAGNRDPRGGRNDSARGIGSGEWPRTNGTRTFRRPSTTPSNSVPTTNSSDATHLPNPDAMIGATNTQTTNFDLPQSTRYSKEEMLDIHRIVTVSSQVDVTTLFAAGWNPAQVNGSSTRSWGKGGEAAHVPQDPTVCWDPSGSMKPISLTEMSSEERELFASDVNSAVKNTQQNKDGGGHQGGGGGGANGRKTSISQGTSGNFNMASPSSSSRPGTRRRETTDTNPFPGGGLASPTPAGRFSRDDPAPWFSRKSTDSKEPLYDEPGEESLNPPTSAKTQSFGANRANTTGASGFSTASSLWGASATAPSPGMGIGAFGNFSLGGNRQAGGGLGTGRGESRLAHLIPNNNNSDVTSKAPDTPTADTSRQWRSRQRTDTDPYGGEDNLTGSAVLGGSQDHSPPSFPSQIQRSVYDTPVKTSTADFGMSGLHLGNHGDGHDPNSPETNPYRSPPADRPDNNAEERTMADRLAGTTEPTAEQPPNMSNMGTFPRAFGSGAGAATFEGSDRSQTSSAGPKAYPSLGNLSGLGGWPATTSVGTPDRERHQPFGGAFGSTLFNAVGDIQSPGLGSLGGVFGPPSANAMTPTGGMRSKLGSLFPPAMQAQMQSHDQEALGDSVPDVRQAQGNPLGAIGRTPIGTQTRDTDSPLRSSARAAFEDIFHSPAGPNRTQSPFTTTAEQAQATQAPMTTTSSTQSFPSSSLAPGNSSGIAVADVLNPHSRVMVMPDRMRWVYLDPQGHVQGPFSGLEMNDWYKANFFSADLRVKKLEDPDFEPLGQLIRRIGNSREPFLVPQMGIPHGPPTQNGPFGVPDSRGGVVPPLQNAFPTFGRTLTADEQNNLERRKQEEQVLMARQREALVQQHSHNYMRMGPGGSLHHHSSAHSLQSQPSFGSVTSPISMPPQPPIGAMAPNAGFFDPSTSMAPGPMQQPSLGSMPAEVFATDLNIQERQMLASMQATGGFPSSFPPSQAPTGPAGTGDANLRSQLPPVDQLHPDEQGFNSKLQEFLDLRQLREREALEAPQANENQMSEQVAAEPGHSRLPAEEVAQIMREVMQPAKTDDGKRAATQAQAQAQAAQATMSLTQQVRKTQADAAAAAAAATSAGLPMPFPPPQPSTPLPAPMAQRARSNLPSQYSSRSASGTPDTSSDAALPPAPPTAPWAGTEAQKGPSLKEIQAAEAKKAAKQEEAAATARRAALEAETAAIREREKNAAAAAAATGLPATSTWGIGSPVGVPPAGSPWSNPTAAKGAMTAGSGGNAASSKKTLADIQREEEVRKQRQREIAQREQQQLQQQQQASMGQGVSMGKRYAELASKPSGPPGLAPTGPASAAGGAWTTVGASGKVRIPSGPAAITRAANAGNNLKAPTAPAAKSSPKSAPKPAAPATRDSGNVAMEEFKKWLLLELSRGLDKLEGPEQVETLANTLLVLPAEVGIIADSVYAHSTKFDGRHFAEEFVRRKKNAEKGVIEKPTMGPSLNDNKNSSKDGWNEVAKKGGTSASNHKDDANVPGGQFKVVPGRKKGKK